MSLWLDRRIVQTLPMSSSLIKPFYSINMVVAERNCLYVLDECFFFCQFASRPRNSPNPAI